MSLLLAVFAVATMAGPASAGEAGTAIIGGHPAPVAPPGIVSVQYDAPAHGIVNHHTCGGALVFRGWVVTGAQCLTDQPGGKSIPTADKRFHVRIGSLDRTAGGEAAAVTQIVVHPQWKWGGDPMADVAMLRLDHLVQQPTVALAGRPAQPGDRLTVFGWGDTEPDSSSTSLPTRLQQMTSTVAPKSACADAHITTGEFCLRNPHGTDGPCRGDAGAPALRMTPRGVPELVGGGSRSADDQHCGTTNGVFTSHPEYRDFIYATARHAA